MASLGDDAAELTPGQKAELDHRLAAFDDDIAQGRPLGRGQGSPVSEATAGMIILFREVAEADLEEAIAYHDAIDGDLAFRLLAEVALTVQRIDNHPEAHPIVH